MEGSNWSCVRCVTFFPSFLPTAETCFLLKLLSEIWILFALDPVNGFLCFIRSILDYWSNV